MTAAQPLELNRLRHQLADLLDVHPMGEWSPVLLRAIIGVLEMRVAEGGLRDAPATVLQLVRNQTD
jgi:hypothetical protein